jgi:hypothetical protein
MSRVNELFEIAYGTRKNKYQKMHNILKDTDFELNTDHYQHIMYHPNNRSRDPTVRKILKRYATRRLNRYTVRLSDDKYSREFTDIVLPPEILNIPVLVKSYTSLTAINKYGAEQMYVADKLSGISGIDYDEGNRVVTEYIASSLSENICTLDGVLTIFHVLNDITANNVLEGTATAGNEMQIFIQEDEIAALDDESQHILRNQELVMDRLEKNKEVIENHRISFNNCEEALVSIVISTKFITSLKDYTISGHRQIIIVNKNTKEIYLSDANMDGYFLEYYSFIANYINTIAETDEYYIANGTIGCSSDLQSRTDDYLCTVWGHLLYHLWLLNSGLLTLVGIEKVLYKKSKSALRVLINAYTRFLGNLFKKMESVASNE